ncbi:MAG: HIT family protein [bacterium]
MTDSIFTKIAKGQAEGEILYRDETCFIMLTIAPHAEGHCMVIPLEQVDNWEELDHGTYIHCLDIAKKMAKLLKSIYNAPKIGLSIVGFQVPHTHIHLIPIRKESDIDHTNAVRKDLTELRPVADKLRSAILAQGGF